MRFEKDDIGFIFPDNAPYYAGIALVTFHKGDVIYHFWSDQHGDGHRIDAKTGASLDDTSYTFRVPEE